jgi:hypothetical protein
MILLSIVVNAIDRPNRNRWIETMEKSIGSKSRSGNAAI